jgi:hypothetical protein
MAANRPEAWSLDEDGPVTVSLEDAQAQDAYWRHAHRLENYFRVGLDYEDYAPAYCVGYAGFAQYGGDFGEAEKSLLSNWLRIKGDSRLGLDEARMAIRSAWDRARLRSAEAAVQAGAASSVRRLLESANEWLDRVFGPRAPRPVPRVVRRAQQGGFARH